MARYLGPLGTRLAAIEAGRSSMHIPFTTETGRHVSLDAREVLRATGEALRWIYDETTVRPSSRALDVLATVDPTTETSVLLGTAVRAARAVAGGERP
jgi:hypothetical protein